MTQTCQQLQLTIFKEMVFVACRVAEFDPFVTHIGFLSVSGVRDLDHLLWNVHCVDIRNNFSRDRIIPGKDG